VYYFCGIHEKLAKYASKGLFIMKICPGCKYERTMQDSLLFPDYECPSCGIIFEKDKARQELAELEKQREKERKAKLERLKKEEEQKLIQEEKRLMREEQERKEKEETERRQELEAARIRQQEEEQKKMQEEERLRQEAEKKLRQDLEEKKKQAEEVKNQIKQRQAKIEQITRENQDKIITPPETEKTYQLFDMCPFNMAQTGKGLSIAGFGESKNKWQHARCMQKYCRLWTLKTDQNGAVYGQGCSLQFLGLSKEEIIKSFQLKNRQILEDTYSLPDTNSLNKNQE
jgi:hypothetical protein